MSGTESDLAASGVESSSSGGNGNGKRGREQESGGGEADDARHKQLKSSDESEKETTSDGRSSSADPTLEDTEAKELETPDPGLSSGDEKSGPSAIADAAAVAVATLKVDPTDDSAADVDAPGDDTAPEANTDTTGTTTAAQDAEQASKDEPTLPSVALVAAAASDPRIMASLASAVVTNPTSVPPSAATTTPATIIPASAAASLTMGLASSEPQVEERGEVSAFYVGRVIGKGGEMIRDLQARSGARIDVDQNVPAGQPRVITYRGTRATVDFAKHLVQLLSTDGVHENDLPLGNAAQEFLVIPAASVGKVIGRGGEMIRELQSRSQAKIQIDHTGVSGMPTDQKQVTLTGTHEAVVKAKEMVLLLVANPLMDAQQALNMLIDDKIRNGTKWGSGPPYHNLPNQGINMQPSQIPGSTPYPGGGGGGTAHAPHQQQHTPQYGMYQPNQPPAHGPPGGGYAMPGQPYGAASQWPASGYPSAASAYSDGRETDVFYAPKQLMGRIIGGKGVTVNDLQRRSGCDIQINQDVTPGQDCEITIKGPRAGIESAKAMIQEIIDVGPQHPYAGGVENYGGGGGGPPHMGGGGGYHGAYANPQYQAYPQQQQHRGFEPQHQSQGGYGGPPYMGQSGGDYGPPGATGGYGAAPYQGGGYAPPPQAAPPMRQAPPQVSAWKAASAPDGQVYYYNEQTGATQWDKPAGMP